MTTSRALAICIALLALAAPACAAEAPKFTATCPTGIEVKSNGKGKIRINGEKTTVKVFNDNAWEARGNGVAVDITRDGSALTLTYTGKAGANGVCTVTSTGSAGNTGSSGKSGKSGKSDKSGRTALNGVSPEDQQACLAAVSNKANNGTVKVLDATTSEANNTVIIGVGKEKAKWRCLVRNGKAADVKSLTSEGAL